MKKFVIAIEETVVEEFEVKANSANEALYIAQNNYKKGEFVISPGEVQSKKISVVNPKSESSEWIEF